MLFFTKMASVLLFLVQVLEVRYMNVLDEQKSWVDADKFCRSMNATLLQVKSERDARMVERKLEQIDWKHDVSFFREI